MSRVWPQPSRMDRTIHFLGDTHLGQYSAALISQSDTRKNKWANDLNSVVIGTPALRVVVGDLIENFGQSDGTDRDALGKSVMNALTPATSWDLVIGNHELAGATDQYRTGAECAAVYGYSSELWTKTLTDRNGVQFVKLISLGISTYVASTPITYPPESLTWLSSELGNTSLPCLILCHTPLKDTVLGSGFNSSQELFYANDDTAIRTILNNNTTAKAWISGHTHSPVTAENFCKSESVGTRNIACISASSTWYLSALPANPHDAICSIFVTVTSTGLEVRARNHGAGTWENFSDGSLLWTFEF